MTDKVLVQLLQRLVRRESAAWEELVRQYSGLLCSMARRTMSGYGYEAAAQDAEDVVAEVWKNLLDRDCRLIRQSLRRQNFLQMLHVLARNRSVDLIRKRRGDNMPLREDIVAELPYEPQEPERPIDLRLPVEALRQLAPRERACVALFFLQRKKYREIETITGIPQNSIGPTLNRALAKLRECLPREEETD